MANTGRGKTDGEEQRKQGNKAFGHKEASSVTANAESTHSGDASVGMTAL
jgi:hypothetical protein